MKKLLSSSLLFAAVALGLPVYADAQTPTEQPQQPWPQISLSIPSGSVTVDGTTYARTSAGIQSAVNACTSTCGNVHLTAGTYNMTGSHVTVHSNLNIYGDGPTATVLQGSPSGDWVFLWTSTTNTIHDFSINNIGFDLQNDTNASGILLWAAHNTVLSNLTFTNGGSPNGWYIQYATPVSSNNTAVIYNFDNYIMNVTMSNHLGTLENILLVNTYNTWIINSTINNSAGPGIGVWQWNINTNIYNFTCTGGAVSGGAVYYNITAFDTNIVNYYSNNCGQGIKGASASDNGPGNNNWGFIQAYNLNIINPTFVGGANTTGSTAVELGAVQGAKIINPNISGYDIGVVIDNGQSPANSMAVNWEVSGGQIFNNNQTNNFNILHPGISIQGNPGANPVYGTIDSVNIYDNQGTPTQTYPIAIVGSTYTYDYLNIIGNSLSAYSGANSVGLSGATLGTHSVVRCNTNYTAGPTQSTC